MESVATILQESLKYKQLIKDIDTVIDSNNSEQAPLHLLNEAYHLKIVSYLQQMNHSVHTFKDIPIFADAARKQDVYLAKLDQDLKPKLNQALILRNIGASPLEFSKGAHICRGDDKIP